MPTLIHLADHTVPDGCEYFFNLSLLRAARFNPIAKPLPGDDKPETEREPELLLYWNNESDPTEAGDRLRGAVAVRMYEFIKGISVPVPQEGVPDAAATEAPAEEARDFELG